MSDPIMYYGDYSKFLKEVYVDPLETMAIPMDDKLARDFALDKRYNLGKSLKESVEVAPPQGLTYEGTNDGGSAHNDSVSPIILEAELYPTALTLKGQISNDILDRCKGSKTAFVQNTKELMGSWFRQARFGREIALLHGGNSLGTFADTVTTDSGTTQVWKLTAGTFSPAMIQRLINAKVDVYNGSTKINTTAPIVITSFVASTRALTLTGVETELDGIGGYDMYLQGQYGNTHIGLSKICGSTTETSAIHGISQVTYSNWQSNAVSCGSKQLNYDRIAEGVAVMSDRGFSGRLNLYMSSKTAKDLRQDIINRVGKKGSDIQYDNKLSLLGFEDITVALRTHKYAKPGEALGASPRHFIRIGMDIRYVPVGGKGEYLAVSENNNYSYFKIRYNQALLCKNPGFTIKWTDIVNKADA